MNTLKIQIPDGFKIDSFDVESGEVIFAPLPKDIKERIKNFGDVLKYHGITMSEFMLRYGDLKLDEQAYIQLKMIASALNEGWTPDWENGKWDKYYPWFVMGSASGVGFSFGDYDRWHSRSGVSSRLCFKSAELAKYAGNQFLEIYKIFMTLK